MRLFVGALGFMSLVACEDDCERASSIIESKARRCDVEIEDTGGGSDTDECGQAEGDAAMCIAGCYRGASCEAIRGEDMEASQALIGCIFECVMAEQ